MLNADQPRYHWDGQSNFRGHWKPGLGLSDLQKWPILCSWFLKRKVGNQKTTIQKLEGTAAGCLLKWHWNFLGRVDHCGKMGRTLFLVGQALSEVLFDDLMGRYRLRFSPVILRSCMGMVLVQR